MRGLAQALLLAPALVGAAPSKISMEKATNASPSTFVTFDIPPGFNEDQTKPYTLHLEVLEAPSPCAYPNIKINDNALSQGGHTLGRGTFAGDHDGSTFIASWSATCAGDEQLLRFTLESLSGRTLASDLAFVARFRQTAPAAIIEVAGNVRTSDVHPPPPSQTLPEFEGHSPRPGDDEDGLLEDPPFPPPPHHHVGNHPDNHPGEQGQRPPHHRPGHDDDHRRPHHPEEHPELDEKVLAELDDLECMRHQLHALKHAIHEKESRLAQEHGIFPPSHRGFRSCDSLKCVIDTLMHRVRGGGGPGFHGKGRHPGGRREGHHHGRRPHGPPPSCPGFPFPGHGGNHTKGNHTEPPPPGPPPPGFCHCLPPPPEGPPDGPPEDAPEPPPRGPHHGPPPPPFDEPPHGPPHDHHGPPPPPPPPPFDGPHGHHGGPPPPPPPPHDGPGSHGHHGPPPPPFDGPHHGGPPGPPGPPPPGPPPDFEHEHPLDHEGDHRGPHGHHGPPGFPPPPGPHGGPHGPPHGPPHLPLPAKISVAVLLFIGILALLRAGILSRSSSRSSRHSESRAERRERKNSRRALRRDYREARKEAFKATLTDFWSRMFTTAGTTAEDEEKQAFMSSHSRPSISESERDFETMESMTDEITEFRNAATLVSEMVAAEERRQRMREQEQQQQQQQMPCQHQHQHHLMPSHFQRPAIIAPPSPTTAFAEYMGDDVLPAYDEHAAPSVIVSDGFSSYTPGSSDYTPSAGSDTASNIDDVLGETKN